MPAVKSKSRSRLHKYLIFIKISFELIISNSDKNINTKNKKCKILKLEIVISMIKANNKIYKSRFYHKTINNFIHS